MVSALKGGASLSRETAEEMLQEVGEATHQRGEEAIPLRPCALSPEHPS